MKKKSCIEGEEKKEARSMISVKDTTHPLSLSKMYQYQRTDQGRGEGDWGLSSKPETSVGAEERDAVFQCCWIFLSSKRSPNLDICVFPLDFFK